MPNRTVVVAFSSLSAIGLLAGCAPVTSAPVVPAAGESSSTTVPAAATQSAAPAAAGSVSDGTYTADGSYVAPSGPETITVTLTLASGAITAVEVAGAARDPQARRHQSDFISGIAAVVVGQPIEGLAVDRVAGSSLTGQGFNAALDAIRAEAEA